jgi:hypothetical protein
MAWHNRGAREDRDWFVAGLGCHNEDAIVSGIAVMH